MTADAKSFPDSVDLAKEAERGPEYAQAAALVSIADSMERIVRVFEKSLDDNDVIRVTRVPW